MAQIPVTTSYGAQAANIARRRALAQAIQAQSMQPIQAPVVPGAQISPVQGFEKLAQAIIGGLANRRLDTEESGLASRMLSGQQDYASLIAKAMTPEPPTSYQPVEGADGVPPSEVLLPPSPDAIQANMANRAALQGGLASEDPNQRSMAGELGKALMAQQNIRQQGEILQPLRESEMQRNMASAWASLHPQPRNPLPRYLGNPSVGVFDTQQGTTVVPPKPDKPPNQTNASVETGKLDGKGDPVRFMQITDPDSPDFGKQFLPQKDGSRLDVTGRMTVYERPRAERQQPLLTANQEQEWDGKYTAYRNTVDLLARVKKSVPLLNDLITAGKIKLAIDPTTSELVLSRATSLTEREKQLAADMQSLSEHINVIRGPLAATGFRGPEAFAALQASRGNLMAQPEITSKVLDNTMATIRGQMGSIARTLKTSRPKHIPVSLMDSYLSSAGGNAQKAHALMVEDGWED